MELETFNQVIKIWENRQYYRNLSDKEVFDLNQKIAFFVPIRSYVMSICRNQTKEVPSNYQIDLDLIFSICHDIGNGNKTIVIFGNSHAMFSHSGIAHAFRNVYSNIWTIFQLSCVPLPENQQAGRLDTVSKT